MDIRRSGFVDDLKASLLGIKTRNWTYIETTKLQVYLANIPDTDEGRKAFVHNYTNYNVLAGSKKIASLYQNDPPEDTIHIAVQNPR